MKNQGFKKGQHVLFQTHEWPLEYMTGQIEEVGDGTYSVRNYFGKVSQVGEVSIKFAGTLSQVRKAYYQVKDSVEVMRQAQSKLSAAHHRRCKKIFKDVVA